MSNIWTVPQPTTHMRQLCRELGPEYIIRELDLRRPIYRPLAAYGHMGRVDLGVKWEETNKVDELRKAVNP